MFERKASSVIPDKNRPSIGETKGTQDFDTSYRPLELIGKKSHFSENPLNSQILDLDFGPAETQTDLVDDLVARINVSKSHNSFSSTRIHSLLNLKSAQNANKTPKK